MWKHHFKNRFLENKNKNAVHIACPFQKKRKSTFSISWIDVQRKFSFPIPDDRYAWLFSLRNMCTQSSTIFFLFIILCIHLSQMYVSIFVCSLSNFKRKMCLRIDFVSVFFLHIIVRFLGAGYIKNRRPKHKSWEARKLHYICSKWRWILNVHVKSLDILKSKRKYR